MKRLFAIFSLLCSTGLPAQTISQMLYDGPPVFHGPSVVGNKPGSDFLFTVPATGKRPITFLADLPDGLSIEANTGIIRGKIIKPGSYSATIQISNSEGKASKKLRIEIGDKLCLTPPLGWNSWNVFTNTLDEKMVMEMADAMVSNGMRDLGYQYINMDDYWHAAARDAAGRPVADSAKFPHGIKWLSDYVHARGLKLGIYSDAGTKTCGKCFGSYTFEEIDAATYAAWGIDLLKYDFCFVPWKKKEALSRYKKMGDALQKSDRSMVYSICNWGLFKPWKWAPEAGGNYWRTTPDIFDLWRGGNPFMMSVMKIIKRQKGLEQYAGPGRWNDPDMLIVGNYGAGKATGRDGLFKGLNDIEYQSHMSLWAMMAAPLLSSCDLRNMSEATRQILMNSELLAINQDELGQQAREISRKNGVRVYLKKLSDGYAVAIFNTRKKDTEYYLRADTEGLSKETSLREVIKHQDTGKIGEGISIHLSAHETAVFVTVQ